MMNQVSYIRGGNNTRFLNEKDLVRKVKAQCRVPVLPPEKIGAMVKELDSQLVGCLTKEGARFTKGLADLLRFVLGQFQDTWSDADFGLGDK